MPFESAISEATTKFFCFCLTGWWRWWVLAPSALSQSILRQTATHSQVFIFWFCSPFVLRWPRVPFDVDIFRCVWCRGERLHIGNCHHKICLLSLLWQFNVMLLCPLEMLSFALSLSALHLYISWGVMPIPVAIVVIVGVISSLFYSCHRLSHHFCARTERNEADFFSIYRKATEEVMSFYAMDSN